MSEKRSFRFNRGLCAAFGLALSGMPGRASATVEFTPHELFRIPFGSEREMLGAQVENGRFLFPRDFTMDLLGHFYIYDSPNHRIARFSLDGRFEMDFKYLPSARQIFAHPDSHLNLWLLITEPSKGLFYGVYDPKGKQVHSAVFSQFDRFRLHVDDASALHVLVSSEKNPSAFQSYVFEEETLLMKKDRVARPSETHHELRKSDRTFFIDQVPDASNDDAHRVNRITDESHRRVSDIQGILCYITANGEVYTRIGDRDINVYDTAGSLKGRLHLTGLRSAAMSVRFDSSGNVYELDGIPDRPDSDMHAGNLPRDLEDLHYTPSMTGLRLIQWQRE